MNEKTTKKSMKRKGKKKEKKKKKKIRNKIVYLNRNKLEETRPLKSPALIFLLAD